MSDKFFVTVGVFGEIESAESFSAMVRTSSSRGLACAIESGDLLTVDDPKADLAVANSTIARMALKVALAHVERLETWTRELEDERNTLKEEVERLQDGIRSIRALAVTCKHLPTPGKIHEAAVQMLAGAKREGE